MIAHYVNLWLKLWSIQGLFNGIEYLASHELYFMKRVGQGGLLQSWICTKSSEVQFLALLHIFVRTSCPKKSLVSVHSVKDWRYSEIVMHYHYQYR